MQRKKIYARRVRLVAVEFRQHRTLEKSTNPVVERAVRNGVHQPAQPSHRSRISLIRGFLAANTLHQLFPSKPLDHFVGREHCFIAVSLALVRIETAGKLSE